MNLDIDCSMEIDRAHRIGKKSQGKNRPIVAKLGRHQTKIGIFAEQKRLDGSGTRIAEQLSERVMEQTRKL